MTFWEKAGLQRKLIMLLIGALFLASSVFLVVLAGHYRSSMINAQARAATQVNELLQGALENAMLKRDIPGLQDILSGLGQQRDVRRVMIIAPSGEVRFTSDPMSLGKQITGPEIDDAIAGLTETTRYLEDAGGESVLRAVNPVQNRAECGACHPPVAEQPINGLLVMDIAADQVREQAIRSTLSLAAIGALVTALGSGTLWLALRRVVVAPLRNLSDAAGAIRGGRHDVRTNMTGADEIAQLGRAFDSMSDELTQSLAAVERSEAELQALIDAIPDGIRVIGPDYVVRKANRAYAAQVGQPPEAIVGQPCYRSSHGRDTPCPATLVTCPVAEFHAGKRDGMTFRDRHQDASGGQVAVEVSSAYIPLDCGDSGAGCVVESIRDLERQMRLSQAERLSEIGLLAAGVAHEIHNPLSSVELAMQALSRDLSAGRTEGVREYFGMIREEITKCLEITDNLLRLSAPPGEGRALIDLAHVVEGTTTLLSYEAERRGLSICTEVTPGLRLLISDADLRMLLTNLIMNAFHAMSGGGTVMVQARPDATGAWIDLSVTDTGIGIAAEDIERIFLPFWTRRGDGSVGRGLGLAIVQSILGRHDATIKVDSTKGKGSVFTLRFPNPDSEPRQNKEPTA